MEGFSQTFANTGKLWDFDVKVRGYAYTACVCKVLLYASKTWPVKVKNVNRLIRNDYTMICWICSA